jgi:hypothetical protein
VTLERKLKADGIAIEPCAVSSKAGIAELHMADRTDVSTLDIQWIQRIKTAKWQTTVPVQVRTLDSLANQYGIPSYVKVDAEGHDFDVLCGMSFEPSIVSFEFHPADFLAARDCVERLKRRSFNFVIEEQSQFELKSWVNAKQILAIVSTLPSYIEYGDIFARTSH